MKSLHTVLAVASLATWTACVVAPGEEAAIGGGSEVAEIGESASALNLPSDHDLSWSGPMTYAANWAKYTFNQYPGIYIFDNDQGNVHGVVHLSPGTVCKFGNYGEQSGHLYIYSNNCSGPIAGLSVQFDCLKQATQLSCTGVLVAGNGAQSGASGTAQRNVVCAPDGCYDGPFTPGPSGPNGPADCPEGQSPCGPSGCCALGQRCGDGSCWTPVDGDEGIAQEEVQGL